MLHSGAAIHWHGFHMHNTPWMDGVGYITQCPISPMSSFMYRYGVLKYIFEYALMTNEIKFCGVAQERCFKSKHSTFYLSVLITIFYP